MAKLTRHARYRMSERLGGRIEEKKRLFQEALAKGINRDRWVELWAKNGHLFKRERHLSGKVYAFLGRRYNDSRRYIWKGVCFVCSIRTKRLFTCFKVDDEEMLDFIERVKGV